MNIFPYHDGMSDRFGDPMRIERILESQCGGSFAALLKLVESPNPDISMPAVDQMLAAVRMAFEIMPFNQLTGQGTTEGFQFDLLDEFIDWRAKKKAITDSPPNSPTPLDGKLAVPPSQPAPIPQTLATDSGLTSPG